MSIKDNCMILLHCSLDRLIDLGSRLEAHGDVLATHEQDEETGEITKLT
jgi:hypothetical protein